MFFIWRFLLKLGYDCLKTNTDNKFSLYRNNSHNNMSSFSQLMSSLLKMFSSATEAYQFWSVLHAWNMLTQLIGTTFMVL